MDKKEKELRKNLEIEKKRIISTLPPLTKSSIILIILSLKEFRDVTIHAKEPVEFQNILIEFIEELIVICQTKLDSLK